jgi:hypothetical protein
MTSSGLGCDAQGGMSGSTIDGGSRGSHAQGIGVVGHVDGDVLGFYLTPIIHNFEGDVTWGDIEPELLWCHDSSRKWLSNTLTQRDDEDYL